MLIPVPLTGFSLHSWAGASHGLCPHITPGDPLVTEEIAEPIELPFVNGPTLRKVETWPLRAGDSEGKDSAVVCGWGWGWG